MCYVSDGTTKAKEWLTKWSAWCEHEERTAHREKRKAVFRRLTDVHDEVSRMQRECRYWDPAGCPGHEPTVRINLLT